MAEVTTKELLDSARTGLKRVLERGESYTIDGRTFNFSNIKDLQALVATMEEAYNSEQGTRPVMQTFNLSGMGY